MLEIVPVDFENVILFELKNNGEFIVNDRCHAIFKINDCLYGYRVGLRWGMVSNKGDIITPLILKGCYEWELSPDQIDDCGRNLMHNEPYNCSFIEETLTNFGTENEQYIFLEDIYGKIVIIDFTGKILFHEKVDDIWKIDRINYFVVFKNGKGNILNCRSGKYLLDKWYDSTKFREAYYSTMFVPCNNKEYKIDNENGNGFIRLLATDENNPERVFDLM